MGIIGRKSDEEKTPKKNSEKDKLINTKKTIKTLSETFTVDKNNYGSINHDNIHLSIFSNVYKT